MNKLTAWIKDYVYLVSISASTYFTRTPPAHYTENTKEGKVPIIFLPGIFERWTFLKPLADHISSLGHPVYVVPQLGPNNILDIPSSARKTYEVISENNLSNVIIVAHSKGGLIGKYLMLHEDKRGQVIGLIAVATPFHGSSIGKFFPHYSIAELLIDSGVIKYLEKHIEINKKIVSIIPSYDNIIWHKDGSHLEGALRNLTVPVAGHHRVLADKYVWNIITNWIDKITSSAR